MLINIKGKYQVRIDNPVTIRRVEKRQGVCSKCCENDTHMLLWDFDNTDIRKIKSELFRIMIEYALPDIYILESSNNHYHAYCFSSRTFKETIHILSDTQYIDEDYLKLGTARGYYTLRFSPKRGRKVKIIYTLKSGRQDEMSPLKTTINEYYTGNI
jgi:hypothetical protein